MAYEPLVDSNQYHCEHCKKRVDALLHVSYRKLPEILILCLFRFEYDMKSGNRVKNYREFKFPMELDMNPYTEENLSKRPLPKTVEEALTSSGKEKVVMLLTPRHYFTKRRFKGIREVVKRRY